MSSTAPYVPDLTGVAAAQEPLQASQLPNLPALIGGAWRGAGSEAALGDLRGIGAGFRQMQAGVGLTNTQQRYEQALYGDMVAAVQKAGIAPPARKVEFLGRTMLQMPGRWLNPAWEEDDYTGRRQVAQDRLFRAYAQARALDPSLPDIGDPDRFAAEVTARRKRDEAAAIEDMPNSALGIASSFVGQLGAGFTDPTVLMTMGVGAGSVFGRTVLGTALKRGAAEAGLQGAVTAVTLPVLFEDAAANGFDYDAGDAALDVALGTLLGGAVGALSGAVEASGIVRQVRADVLQAIRATGTTTARDARRLVDAMRSLGRPLTPDEESAVRTIEAQLEVEAANPFGTAPEAQQVHGAAIEEAVTALETGTPIGLPDMPPVAPDPRRAAATVVDEPLESDFILDELIEAGDQLDAWNRALSDVTFTEKADWDAIVAEWEKLDAELDWHRAAGTEMPAEQLARKAELQGMLDARSSTKNTTLTKDELIRLRDEAEAIYRNLQAEYDAAVKAEADRPRAAAATGGQMESGGLYDISARDLQTDPETFQYKGGGDAEGVTDKLRGVTEWNPDAANVIMVWQRKDGTLFVADGHQRSGLARRLIAEGRYADIKLLARVYREADGITAEQAMLRAAGANIVQGLGDETDAAKIIRRIGVESQFLSGLNMQAAFGKRALGLARLSDEAFGMVLNGTQEDAVRGAVVGRVAPDAPELHAQMLAALRKADLRNEQQMDLMARDMLAAPRTTETQTDMFGSLAMTRGLWAERAQVLDRALGMIERAKRALASAAENVQTLEEVGGRVDRGAAMTASDINRALAAAVRKLATRTDNPINAALSRAAVKMAEGVKPDDAARQFIADLRAQPGLIDDIAAGGDGSGIAAGDQGRERRDGGGAAPEGSAGAARAEDAGDAAGLPDDGGFDPDGAIGSLFGDDAGADGGAGGRGPARPAAGADGEPGLPGIDRGAAQDPATGDRQRAETQIRANMPLRPGMEAEQADVDGLELFDPERSPTLPGTIVSPTDSASGRLIAEFDDPLGSGAEAQADLLMHDLRNEVKAGRELPPETPMDRLRSTPEALDAQERVEAALLAAVDQEALRQGRALIGDLDEEGLTRLIERAMAGEDAEALAREALTSGAMKLIDEGEPPMANVEPLEPSKVVPAPTRTIHAAEYAGPEIAPTEAAARLAAWKAEAKRIGQTPKPGKVILSLFDASGVMAQPYRDMGYEVYQLDLKNGYDLLRDMPDILEWIAKAKEGGAEIVGVIAQPPCTTFAGSGARWWDVRHNRQWDNAVSKMWGSWAEKRFDSPVEYNQFLVMATQEYIAAANPQFFVIENPVGRIDKLTGLPKPQLVIQPHHFGAPYTKRTHLWGKFNPELPTAHVAPTEGSRMHKLRGRDEKDEGLRSLTPEEFAYAFALSNAPGADVRADLPGRPGQAMGVAEPGAAYSAAPNSLMGFAGDPSRQKEFGQTAFPIEQAVRVTMPDGDTFDDVIEGMNQAHALERARRNWDGAEVEALGDPVRRPSQGVREPGAAYQDRQPVFALTEDADADLATMLTELDADAAALKALEGCL